ncbi:Hypothetical_protein [Hexamita inflata]|uniref:Hypothetical_protein n=1 Tax=Hexamita inflata TaxID=28002 RepID=A0AA86QDP7_9EUKA|nr:Hypothetical protein HINF_LOCUS37795 [Hexamita inflata]
MIYLQIQQLKLKVNNVIYKKYTIQIVKSLKIQLKILRTDQNFYKSKNRPQIGHLRTDLRCERKTIQVQWPRAYHQRAFRNGKRQPLHCFLRNADGTMQVDFRIDRLARNSRVTPWMFVPESLVAFVAEVRLTYIGVSKTNEHQRELTVPEDRTSINESQISEIYIQIINYILSHGTTSINYSLTFRTCANRLH